MADISKIKLPDGVTYDIKDESKSSATNWVNGSATGSARTVYSQEEGDSYTMGTYAIAEGGGTKASGQCSHAEGGGTTASGSNSHAEGSGTAASGNQSHAEGGGSQATGDYSHAEGYVTTASGYNTHAEGNYTRAIQSYAHAEGNNTTASGEASHAEGTNTTASGAKDHAEGYQTTASGGCAHAEGYGTTASGLDSHAEGDSTIANHLAQHVFGQYNIADTSTAIAANRGNYVEIVGNGSYNARSNARTLDWSGNEVLAGKLTVGIAGTNSLDVATIGQLPTKTSDLTNDSGFITTDSDEKVKITSTSTANLYYLTFLDTGNTPITKGLNVHVGNLIYKNDGTTTAIEIGSSSFKGAIHLKTATGSAYQASIEPGSLTGSRVVTLPDKSGTIALTSDIPDVSGFITTETDPIFTASAAHGISSTDITNWNGKQAALVSGTNIKTVNNESLLGSGNITIEGGASIPYLTCADEASTVAKTTTLVSGTLPPTLEVGQQIVVKFSYYNSATDATLEVGTYGAIPMKRYGTTTIGTDIKTSWHSGAVCSFTYDGTNWVLHSDFDENTTYVTAKSNTSGIVPAASSTNSVLRRTTGTTIDWGKVTNLMLNTASSTPTNNYVAEFDSTAHMNSTDMTETEVDDFVDGLDAQGESLDNFLDSHLNTLGGKNTGTVSLYNCSGTVSHNNLEFLVSEGGEIWVQGRININSYVRSGSNSGVKITLPDIVPTPTKEFWSMIGFQSQHPREYVYISLTPNSRAAYIQTSESFNNTTNGTLTFICSGRVFVK